MIGGVVIGCACFIGAQSINFANCSNIIPAFEDIVSKTELIDERANDIEMEIENLNWQNLNRLKPIVYPFLEDTLIESEKLNFRVRDFSKNLNFFEEREIGKYLKKDPNTIIKSFKEFENFVKEQNQDLQWKKKELYLKVKTLNSIHANVVVLHDPRAA